MYYICTHLLNIPTHVYVYVRGVMTVSIDVYLSVLHQTSQSHMMLPNGGPKQDPCTCVTTDLIQRLMAQLMRPEHQGKK